MKSILKKFIGWSLLLILSGITFTNSALAHSGGTNSEGCHTKKSTGEYHCHNKK
ncbi:hypothetical protein EC843_101674 [Buttiauxella sp. JUb87]|jgi:hypothetical protein|uniref:YHYH domain-containing protein n=1 Tax=Buttiauxella sp. JUb87 TaxID=2485129 RepID=UPI00105F0120|nr:YHYH domain-containing protein [Buttiauxella sp. JUb87]TDN54628.1 hypothetical protein EC843_101674 [Buttiauxella sp. JUb87]